MSEAQRDDLQAETSEPSLLPKLLGIDDLPVEYVNVIQANHDPYQFQVAFGQFVPPMAMNLEDQRAFADQIRREGLPVRAVCRLIIAPAHLRDMVKILEEQIETYEKRFGPIPRLDARQSQEKETEHGH